MIDQPQPDCVWIGTAIDIDQLKDQNKLAPPLYHGDNITNHGLGLQGE
jgi:hypothetical protein